MSYLTLSFMPLICLVKNEIHVNIQMPLLSINVTMKKVIIMIEVIKKKKFKFQRAMTNTNIQLMPMIIFL